MRILAVGSDVFSCYLLLPCSLALCAQLAAVCFGRSLVRQRRFVPQNPVLPMFFSVHPNSRLAIWQKIDVSSKITRNRRKLGIRDGKACRQGCGRDRCFKGNGAAFRRGAGGGGDARRLPRTAVGGTGAPRR